MRRLFNGTKFRIIVCTAAVLILGAVFAAVSHSSASPLTSAVSFVFSPLNRLAMYCTELLGDYRADFTSSSVYLEELEALRAELAEKDKQLADYERMKQKISTYEAFLELKENNPDYKFASGSVISHDAADVYSSFVIDCGSSDGVAVNDPVLYDNNIVGIVKKVNTASSVVLCVTDPRVNIGAYELSTGERGFVSGDARLAPDGVLRMSGLTTSTAVVTGGTVCSSGSGGIFPPDLVIGEVESVEDEEGGLASYAVVRPRLEVSGLSEVFVLLEFEGQGEADDFSLDGAK